MFNSFPIYRLLLMTLLLVACAPEAPHLPFELAKIPVDIGPIDMAVNSQTGYIYIVSNGRHVAVLKDLEQVALLKADNPPSNHTEALAIDETRGWVYVVDFYAETVIVIRETEVVAVVETLGRQPRDVAVDSRNGWAYVVGPYRKTPPFGERPVIGGHITVLDGPEQVGTIELGNVSARHVVVDPIHGYVYVGGGQLGGGGVVVVLKDMEEVARFETVGSLTPQVMDVNPQTGEVYVTDSYWLYRFVKGQLVETIQPVEGSSTIRNLRVHPTTGDVYLVNWGSRTEALVVRGSRVIGRAPIGPGGLKMDIDSLSGNVYLADFWSNQVTVMHGREVIATLGTGAYPYGVGVNPTNGRVYISNTNEGTVTVLGLLEE